MKYISYNEIDSTNNEAKRLISAGKINEETCLAAKMQTAGRGRQGKSFFSPDTGLYMTVVFPMDCEISSQVTMTTRTACAVAEAIETCTGKKARIKWVNDIYVNNKKCCGILCEAVNDYDAGRLKYVVIGIGINIYTKEWPQELKNIAGSLYEESYQKIPDDIREALMKTITDRLEQWLFKKEKEEFIKEYKAYSNVLGREIIFLEDGIKRQGKAVDIDENGSLVVSLSDSEGNRNIVLNSGEISLRIIE